MVQNPFLQDLQSLSRRARLEAHRCVMPLGVSAVDSQLSSMRCSQQQQTAADTSPATPQQHHQTNEMMAQTSWGVMQPPSSAFGNNGPTIIASSAFPLSGSAAAELDTADTCMEPGFSGEESSDGPDSPTHQIFAGLNRPVCVRVPFGPPSPEYAMVEETDDRGETFCRKIPLPNGQGFLTRERYAFLEQREPLR